MTRRTRSALAARRHGVASALTVMFFALTVAGAHALCSSHGDDNLHAPQAYHDIGQAAAQPVDAQTPAVDVASTPADGAQDCAGHHLPQARCDPLPPASSPGTAAIPEPSAGRLTSVAAHVAALLPVRTAEATAPSLHALGILRT